MADRSGLGSWLQGPGAAGGSGGEGYPGDRLGRPPEGLGSVAGIGPRLLAFLVDTVMCAAIAWGIPREPALTTPIFAAEVLLLTALGGASAGQRVVGLQVIRVDGRPIGLARAALRTLLLLLLVPALVWDRDLRGLHDKAAGTVLVRAR